MSRRNRQPDPFDGILLVDKPTDWTSHHVVAKIRNQFKLKKVGHGGTLDPLATGLLVTATFLSIRGRFMSVQGGTTSGVSQMKLLRQPLLRMAKAAKIS